MSWLLILIWFILGIPTARIIGHWVAEDYKKNGRPFGSMKPMTCAFWYGIVLWPLTWLAFVIYAICVGIGNVFDVFKRSVSKGRLRRFLTGE